MVEKIVSQDSRLGSLGLSALLHAGYCGPNYDLSDLSVRVYGSEDKNSEESFDVCFYDMSTFVGPDNKYYGPIKEAFYEVKSQK